MATLNISRRLSKYFPTAVENAWRPRGFVTATNPLQKTKSDDKESAENFEKVTEAADAVKEGEGAKEVRQTCEFVKDTVTDAAKSVTKMTKKVTEKVSEATENITAAKGTMVKGAIGVAKKTAEVIKDKVGGK